MYHPAAGRPSRQRPPGGQRRVGPSRVARAPREGRSHEQHAPRRAQPAAHLTPRRCRGSAGHAQEAEQNSVPRDLVPAAHNSGASPLPLPALASACDGCRPALTRRRHDDCPHRSSSCSWISGRRPAEKMRTGALAAHSHAVTTRVVVGTGGQAAPQHMRCASVSRYIRYTRQQCNMRNPARTCACVCLPRHARD